MACGLGESLTSAFSRMAFSLRFPASAVVSKK